ncbi:MAG: hypothetical protein LBT93_05675 [Treponema sp.]|nr:hypothetical protein [Treponema sp.]
MLVFFLLISPLLSCFKTTAPTKPAVAEGPAASETATSLYGLSPRFILEPGEVPLWFELGPEGPLLINAPGAAALVPFEPWPLSRFIVGFLSRGDTLFLAINRDGFLIFTPRAGEGEGLTLYRAAEPALWDPYTVGSFFLYRDLPAVLLYRDDFFADPVAEAPSPRVWGLVPGIPGPVGLEIPSFEVFPPGAGWDIDALRLGQGGRWYYRGVQKSSSPKARTLRYLRTADLSLPGEETSFAAFQESLRPESAAGAPPLLRLVLEEAFKLNAPARSQSAAILFPGFSAPRHFIPGTVPGSGDEELINLVGYYRDAGPEGFSDALVILGDGRGIYGRDRGSGPETEPFSLPPFQEGFVYTGLAPAGTALIASWEEQEGFNVGAAGFMVINNNY